MLFSIALDAVSRNKLRALLAVTGLAIGVAAVMTMVALGNGARQEVTSQVKSAGTNVVFVRAGNYVRGGDSINIPSGLGKAETLVTSDRDAIRELAGVSDASAVVEARMPASSADRRLFGEVMGLDESGVRVLGFRIAEGRSFERSEVEAKTKLVLMGIDAADELIPERGDMPELGGLLVDVGGESFEVLGVFESGDPKYARMLVVPFTVLQEAQGLEYLHGITISVDTAGESSSVAEAATRLLRERHRLDEMHGQVPQGESRYSLRRSQEMPNDFTVTTQATAALTRGLYTSAAAFVLASMPRLDEVTSEEMVNTLQRSNQTMEFLLGSLAALSLIVGGVGIMNVMLLSVTERTREIGLRMSVGARSTDVLWQFLYEAILISMIGGLAGIGLGFFGAQLMARFLGWPAYVNAVAVGLAFGLSVAVGIFFGWYPALRAAQLDPIDALRYE